MTDLSRIITRISNTTYVVLLKVDGKLTLLTSPGESQPWHTKNKKLADFHAKENNGMAATWSEAWRLLLKENPKFEQELMERIRMNADKTVKGINFNSVQTQTQPPSNGTILGPNGNAL